MKTKQYLYKRTQKQTKHISAGFDNINTAKKCKKETVNSAKASLKKKNVKMIKVI